MLVDTCPLPTGAWATSTPSSPGADTDRRRVALQLPTGGSPGVLAVDEYSNGSFYAEYLKRFVKMPDVWQTEYVAEEQWGFSVARGLATTSGDDPCVAYTDDYDNYVRLVCDSITDRIVAPGGAMGLAMGAVGPLKHIVRITSAGSLEYFTTDGGTPTVPEEIEADGYVNALSLAVDAEDRPHLAYQTELSSNQGAHQIEIRYATLTNSGWEITTVLSETAASSENSKGSVSLALDPYGNPSVAYHHVATRSLEIVELTPSGFGAPVILDAPQPNFESDNLGRYVVLDIDCYARRRVVYSRSVSTDPDPDSHLYFGIATDSGLEQREMVPLLSSFGGYDYDLAYQVDPDGHDHIAVNTFGVQYTTR